jgi:hypothetical protein
MAHELLIQNGRAAMFYVNEAPWHGQGSLALPVALSRYHRLFASPRSSPPFRTNQRRLFSDSNARSSRE